MQLHTLVLAGLLCGIYSDAGAKTCDGYPGSRGFEKEDAEDFASWGVDYLKYDNCYCNPEDPVQGRYTAMRDALNATGRPIVFAMCVWGVGEAWRWGPQARPQPALLAPHATMLSRGGSKATC